MDDNKKTPERDGMAFPSAFGKAERGLTKRQYAAIMAMQGIMMGLTEEGYNFTSSDAKKAVIAADLLFNALDSDKTA